MLVGALPTSGQDKVTLNQASITKLESNGSYLELSDGSKFTVELSYRDTSKKWAKGLIVLYRPSPDGPCAHYEVQNGEQYVCVFRPLLHGGRGITIQVVQMLTKNSIVTESSSFAWAMASLIPSSQRNAAQGLGTSAGTSVSTEVTKLVGMDVILNDQKVRLRCASYKDLTSGAACHGLNANSYNSELKGADVWITSYGMRWDAKQEKLVQEEYNEHWKIVGPWE